MRVAALVLAIAGAPLARAELRLSHVTTSHFDIYVEAEPAQARRLASDLEDAYAVLWQLVVRTPQDPDIHARVLLAKDPALFRRIEGQAQEHLVGIARDEEGMPLISGLIEQGERPAQIAVHELSHLFLGSALPFRSPWIDEGLATYLMSLHIDGTVVVLGERPSAPGELDGTYSWKATDLFTLDRRAWNSLPSDKALAAYQEAWEWIHFLIHGDDGRHRRGFEKYLAALMVGPDVDLGLVLGEPLPTLEESARAYGKREKLETTRIDAPALLRGEVKSCESVPEPESAEVIAYALTVAGHADAAARELPADPTSALGSLAQSRILVSRGKSEAAARVLDAGLARHPDDAELHLERARLLASDALRETRRGRSREPATDLDLATAIAPFMAAIFQEAAWQALEADDAARATSLAKRAIRLHGGRLQPYLILSQALARSGDLDRAIEILSRAISLAPDDESRRMLEGLLEKLRGTKPQRVEPTRPRKVSRRALASSLPATSLPRPFQWVSRRK